MRRYMRLSDMAMYVVALSPAIILGSIAWAQEEAEYISIRYNMDGDGTGWGSSFNHVGNAIPRSFPNELSEQLWLRGRVRDLRTRADFFDVDLGVEDIDRLQPVIHDVWIPVLDEYFPEDWEPEYQRLWTTVEALQVDMVERANDRELTVESEQEVMALAEALRRSAEGNGAN